MKEQLIIDIKKDFGNTGAFETGSVILTLKDFPTLLKYKEDTELENSIVIPQEEYNKLSKYLYVNVEDFNKLKSYNEKITTEIISPVLVSLKPTLEVIENFDLLEYKLIYIQENI